MLEIKLLPKSEIEIIGEISADVFMSGRRRALQEFSQKVDLNGFRKGKIPENILINHVGNNALLEKMAIIALENAYPKIITEQKIKAIGRPEISITKMAENNPLGFKIKTAILPEITLPDYRNIAQKTISETKKEITVEEKEVDEIIDKLRKTHTFKNEKGEEVLPELNDDFAKKLGKFDGMGSLRKTIKENLAAEKQAKEKSKIRTAIVENIGKAVEAELPDVLIEGEKLKMLEETRANITQMGLKWEDYLAHIKKKEEELLKDWNNDAAKRVKYGLILEEIAEKEKIEIPAEELEKEAKTMADYYGGLGKEIDLEKAKNYLYGTMRNEKAFQILEEIK